MSIMYHTTVVLCQSLKIDLFTVHNIVGLSHGYCRVSTACITKCFQKAGMCSFSGCGDNDDYNGNDSYDEEFNNWMIIDDDLPIYHIMDDREIVDAVLEERKKEANSTFPGEDNDGDNDDEKEERMPIKKPEVLNAVDFLRRTLEENEIGDLYFTTLNEIKAKLLVALPQKQSVITNFFRNEMSQNEIITFQFWNYPNFIGTHWWNLQENSFVYTSDVSPEINFDVLFREGLNYRKEVTYTPRLLLTDLKDSFGVHHLQASGFERLEYAESLEKLLTLRDNYN
ncbi:hypothetical protein PGB90_010663 [Kerria lacca]